jgi:hypothetical protein
MILRGVWSLILKVEVNWPKDRGKLEEKAADIISDILIRKLQPRELEKLEEILKDDSINITM